MAVFPVNCTIVFQIGTGKFQNDRLGNPQETKQPFTLKASLKIDEGKRQNIQQNPGSNESITYFIGYCVTPKFMPQSIKEGMTGQATITDPATGNLLTGTLTITSLFQTRFKQVTKVLGSKFECYYYAS